MSENSYPMFMIRPAYVLPLAVVMSATFVAASDLEKGRALTDAGKGAEAETLLVGVWNEKKPDAEVAYELGRAMQLQRKFDKAETYYAAALEQATEIRKRDIARGVQALAQIHVRRKEFDAAEKMFRDAIQKDPKIEVAHEALKKL